MELSERHSDRLLRTINQITRNWHDAEDALQDAMLKAFAHLKDFQEKSSFSTWLTRIAINSALMIIRKKRGYYDIPTDGADDSSGAYQRWEAKSLIQDPESRLARRETEELLRDAILRLPPVFREVVELRQTRECSVREIAQTLGISVSAVKSRLARARVDIARGAAFVRFAIQLASRPVAAPGGRCGEVGPKVAPRLAARYSGTRLGMRLSLSELLISR